jgi:Prokaryotic homologs of the JAB domain
MNGRRRPSPRLQQAPLRGRFLVAESAWSEVERIIPSYRDAGGDHEGIAFLFGRRLGDVTILTTTVAPQAETGPGHVHCDRAQMTAVVRAGREHGVALLAQVHSHGRGWIEHSHGDDSMIFMPFGGMLSIVLPWYGRVAPRPIHNLGVHQFQEGRWVAAEAASVATGIALVPAGVDLR